jgi:hypothetical protein
MGDARLGDDNPFHQSIKGIFRRDHVNSMTNIGIYDRHE